MGKLGQGTTSEYPPLGSLVFGGKGAEGMKSNFLAIICRVPKTRMSLRMERGGGAVEFQMWGPPHSFQASAPDPAMQPPMVGTGCFGSNSKVVDLPA
jgi:hypothetical protein